ncbi:DNA cytosine methyltransferase [Imbroritus primus]|uniref:DNA cytosine methyltransferase n=1 Tax=Imbroritus primus TaxID=3058603 RepID=UPI003D160584
MDSGGRVNELALFAGAGGGILGGKLLGWRTVCAVERDAYAAQVLAQRQNDGILEPFPIWSDVCSFDGTRWNGIVDVVSGGFPCQDITVAGNGAGLDGERSGLWTEFARILGEVRPRFAYIENSPALVNRGLDRVLCDLAALGCNVRWDCLSAADLGAPHDRDRIWIVGTFPDADRSRQLQPQRREPLKRGWAGNLCAQVPHTDSDSLQGLEPEPQPRAYGRSSGLHSGTRGAPRWPAWPAEPNVGRVADGVANRVDRVKAVGNGQVSRVAAAAWHLLAT